MHSVYTGPQTLPAETIHSRRSEQPGLALPTVGYSGYAESRAQDSMVDGPVFVQSWYQHKERTRALGSGLY